MNNITKQELMKALFDILDGNSSSSDIKYETGLSAERSGQIAELYKKIVETSTIKNYIKKANEL